MKVRFAPSPTGYLHVGNIRACLINYLFAKKNNGTFFLRIDDTDQERSTEEFRQGIFNDLAWLGIHYDETFNQSDRFVRYDEISDLLRRHGYLYPCYETPEELEIKRKLQLSRGLPPIYDRHSLDLSQEEKESFEREGRKPHWRFKLPDHSIQWDDAVRGTLKFPPATMSDPILIREDGSYLYSLPSVIDDLDYEITHVFRGEDHISNTAVQIPMFEAIAKITDRKFNIIFGHTSFLVGAQGEALSKRLQSLSIRDLKFLEPFSILSYLTFLGTSNQIEIELDFDQLTKDFDIASYGGGTPKFNPDDIELLNAKLFHTVDLKWLKTNHIETKLTDEQWKIIKFNITKRSDIPLWEKIFDPSSVFEYHDTEFAKFAIECLPEGQLDESAWKIWTDCIKGKTGKKGKDLFHPLRLILTGFDSGPEMRLLLPMLGRDLVVKRLS